MTWRVVSTCYNKPPATPAQLSRGTSRATWSCLCWIVWKAGTYRHSKRQLTAAKVKYIVINRNNMSLLFHWYPEDGPKEQYPLNYPILYDGPDLTVLRVY